MTVETDADWMNRDHRTFPVEIDPTVAYGVYLPNSVNDACAYEGQPTTAICIDIEGLAQEYCGFDIKYDNICEDDLVRWISAATELNRSRFAETARCRVLFFL